MSSKRARHERVHPVWFCLYKVQVWIKLVCAVKCQDSGYFWGARRNSDWEEAWWLLSTWNVWLPLRNNSSTCALKVYPYFFIYAKYPEMFLCESETHSVMSDSLQPHKLHSPWNSPDQNIGVVVFPFSRGSSQPRDWTRVFRISDGFFTSWITREAQNIFSWLFFFITQA